MTAVIDSQVHIWEANRPDRPWASDRKNAPHRDEPLTADEILSEMDEAGVDAAILVPPSWEGDYNDVALAAAAAHPDRFGVMGRLVVDAPGSREMLRTWRQQPGMLGVRFTFRRESEVATLTDADSAWIWNEAERAGVPLMVYPPGLLGNIDAIAERHPGLRIIVDHMAADRAKGHAAFARVSELLRLARRPNVGVKVSSLPFYSAQDYPFEDLHEPIRRVYDAFGPERLFWGSDLSRLPCTYAQAIALFTGEFDWLSASDKDWIMGRALADWLDWPLRPLAKPTRSDAGPVT